MKILLTLAALFLMTAYFFLSCTKDSTRTDPPRNLPPIANAGSDTTIVPVSCSQKVSLILDGSGSSDPEGSIVSYSWRLVSGQGNFLLHSSNLDKARIENLSAGEYAFELTVKDAGALTSTDTIRVSVKSIGPKEYDLDISFNSSFFIYNNVEDCYYRPCSYYDLIEIIGKGSFNPLGDLNINFSDYSDTAASQYANYSGISIYNSNNVNSQSVHGRSSVNLKKLFQQGGGPFTGTFTIEAGSAKRCDEKIFDNLPPLTVTGNLDTTSRKVTLSIKGKTFF